MQEYEKVAIFDKEIALSKTRGQSNLTKSASWGAHSPVRGYPRGSKFEICTIEFLG